MIDAPWYVDMLLMLVMAAAGFYEALNIAMLGHSVARWLRCIGWIGLTFRFAVGLMLYGNIQIHAASMPFLLAIAAGTVVSALQQLRTERVHLYCLREPDLRCNREDRIKDALRRRGEP